MTYAEAVARILGLRGGERAGMRPGLERIEALLDAIGRPEQAFAIAQVGGTNGKGSISAMLAAVLQASGRRVGLYTSPHLRHYRERIRVDGRPISEADFADGVEALGTLIARLDATVFEAGTALALDHFCRSRVDVAVLEVGLGGRLDATNVIERPLCTVVTSIARDHVEVLGESTASIAREKAGIFKSRVPAVLACDDLSARVVLLGKAARVRAPAYLYGRDFDERDLPPLGLVGEHQRRNAALARQALSLLPSTLAVSRAAVATGFAGVKWPGRLERLTPKILVDAAHNEEGARALVAALPADARLTLILGLVADKDARAIVRVLAPRATRVIATAPPSLRALSPARLAELIPSAETAPDLAAALQLAGNDSVVVAGSLFLVGEARRLVLGEPADTTAVQDPVGQKL
jgi:dihydrofolate synthase/folylpolyglutamate synthase